MSIKVMDKVWDRYPEGGGELNLALKLADYADDDGTHIFPSIETMAAKTRQSERAVQYQIKRMLKRGWLILVANQGGGRGRAREYRINPDWIKGADLAPISDGSKGADSAPNEKGANGDEKGANGATKGANDDAKGCNSFAPDSSGTTMEPSENRQPARRAPRVALHVELREFDLPDWLPRSAWHDWCEHREAKAAEKSAPWTRPAASVSVRRLAKLRELGHEPAACIDEAVLRGWTGLFPLRADSPAVSSGQSIVPDWWKSVSGIDSRAKQLGIEKRPDEHFQRFKARVYKAAGPGEWMEEMLRSVKDTESVYIQLYAYFNDVPREQVAHAEAA